MLKGPVVPVNELPDGRERHPAKGKDTMRSFNSFKKVSTVAAALALFAAMAGCDDNNDANSHIAPPELLTQTWLPQAVPGQSRSLLQGVVCAYARPAASRPARLKRTLHRLFGARRVIL